MEQNEIPGVDPVGDGLQEIKTVEELRTSIDSLVETITEQVVKEEEEKLKALEVQAEEENLLAEQEKKSLVSTEEQTLAEEEFRTEVLKAMSELNSNVGLLNESVIEQKKIELHNNEMFSNSLGNIKQSSDLATIFLCLIPLFIVYKWLSDVFDGAFR